MKKRLVALLLVLVMVLSVAGCSKKNDGAGSSSDGSGNLGSIINDAKQKAAEDASQSGASSSDQGSVTNPGTSGTSGSSDQSSIGGGLAALSSLYLGKCTPKIYMIDNGEVFFSFTGDVCSIVANDENYEKNVVIEVFDSSSAMRASFQVGNYYWNVTDELTGSMNWSHDGGWASPSVINVSIGTDFASCFDSSFTYNLYFFDSSMRDYDKGFVASGKLGDITESISLEAFNEIRPGYQPSNEAHDIWCGAWKTDEWSSAQGYFKVSKTKEGTLLFEGEYDGTEISFLAEETEYDEVVYDYGSFYTGACKGVNMQNSYADVTLDMDYSNNGSIYVSFSDYSGDTSIYVSNDFRKFGTGEKPLGYVDEDKYGIISAGDPMDNQYFLPVTDDFVISYYEDYSSTTVYTSSDYSTYESYQYDQATLRSFNTNGYQVDSWIKYIYRSADEAQKVFDYMTSQGYYEMSNYVKFDNIIYYHDPYNYSYYSKLYALDYYTWYPECHYAEYGYSSGSTNYLYMSKPITSDEINFTVEDAIKFAMIESGEHRSTDDRDSYMYLYSSSSSAYPEITFYLYEGYSRSVSLFSDTTRYSDGTALSIYLDDYSSWSNTSYVYVSEIVFGEEKATLTQYRYEVEDIANCGITLDNYKTFTAVESFTHSYDLLHTVNN